MNAAPPHRPAAAEISALLATGPFATAARGGALVVGAGHPARLVFATPRALATLGARDLDALDAALFSSESPGARRLRQLAREMPLGAAPRLESLRFFVGRKAIPLGWMCARVAGPDGREWLVAAAPTRAGEEELPAAPESESPAIGTPPRPDPPSAPDREAPPFLPTPIDGPVRFLWSCDDQGRFGVVDAALTKRLGQNAPREGETVESVRARIVFDAEDRWGAAIMARRTFAGLRVEWPEPGGARARVVTLSGTPIIDRARGFVGFRGFGIFTGESTCLDSPQTASQIDGSAASHALPIAEQVEEAAPLDPRKAEIPFSEARPVGIPTEYVTPPEFATAARSEAPARHARDMSRETEIVAETTTESWKASDTIHSVASDEIVASPGPTAAEERPSRQDDTALALSAENATPEPENPPTNARSDAHVPMDPATATMAPIILTAKDEIEASPTATEKGQHPSGGYTAELGEPIPMSAAEIGEAASDSVDVTTEARGAAGPVAVATEERAAPSAISADQPRHEPEAAAQALPIANASPEHEKPSTNSESARPTEGNEGNVLRAGEALAATGPIVSPANEDIVTAPAPTEADEGLTRGFVTDSLESAAPTRETASTPPASASAPEEAPPIAFESLEAEISAVFAESGQVAEVVGAHFAPPEEISPDPRDVTPSAAEAGAAATTSEAKEASPPAFADDAGATKSGRDGGAEIYRLRPPPASTNAPNVVPIRPGAIGALTLSGGDPGSPRELADPGENVELSSQERDAFREIARALGVRPRDSRSDRPNADPISAVDSDSVVSPAAAGEPTPEGGDIAALLDMLPIGALVTRSGEALYINRTLLELIGYPSLAAFRAENGLERIFRGRDPTALVGDDGDLPMVAAGGELMNVDAQARAIVWGGEAAVMIALRRSRMMEHQAALRAVERDARAQAASARDLAAALDMAADGMIRLDDTGRILGMNRRAEALLGYDQKEAAGESFLVLLIPSSQAEATAALDRVTREPVSSTRGPGPEVFARERGGRAIPVRMDFGRLSGAGAPEYFALLHDLSRLKGVEREREAAREAAVKASERKTDFLARVSHEIRTPLHAILGFAEVIIEERFGPIGNDRYKDYIKDIHASGRHVMSLANDLLDLAKIESGKMELQFAPVDINKIIRECVALMQPQAARERIIMRLSLLDRLPNVMADERSLRQIMLNLMSNAVKYNEPGGQVIVSTALDEAGHAVIRVRDTGIGMNDSELGVALEPFRRVPGAARDGTGLGLPLTKALAEANHADFSIKSRKEHGTLVEVAFPRERAAQ
jgi:PAS domain S-box-containing protein